MKFKVTKIATAVAVGLGVSATGLNVAHADGILFPYFAVSSTVTSVVTTINLAGPTPGVVTATNPQTLHYRFFYKSGTAGYTAPCQEFDTHRITSQYDAVTFDLIGKYGDKLGVLAEPANRQSRVDYNKDGKSFAMMKGLEPARGYLLVDNNDPVNVPFEQSIFGEIMLLDFSEGAVWGYAAYNAGATGNGVRAGDSSVFADSQETSGEVLAGNRALTPTAARTSALGGVSPAVPVNILPIKSDAGDPATLTGDVFTRFFVTPIMHEVLVRNADTLGNAAYNGDLVVQPWNGGVTASTTVPPTLDLNPLNADPATGRAPYVTATAGGVAGQESQNLQTTVRLTIQPFTGTSSDVLFDRDERPVSGQVPQNVVCVAAVRVQDLVSTGALLENGDFGGWSGIQISSPGALIDTITSVAGATALTDPVIGARRTNNTNQATVIKLEYNPDGQFLGDKFKGAFNNSIWVRFGVRESDIPVTSARLAGDFRPIQTLTSVKGAVGTNGPVAVGTSFTGTTVSVQQ